MGRKMVLGIVKKICRGHILNKSRLLLRGNNAFQSHASFFTWNPECEEKRKKNEKIPYYTRLAYSSDHDAIMCMMRENYLKNEPSIVNLGLSGHADSILEELLRGGLKEGLSIVAIRCKDEGVIGAAINAGSCPWNPDRLTKIAECCATGPTRNLLKFYAHVTREPNLWKKYDVLKIWECSSVGIDKNCQGMGIAKKLIEDSWYLARDCGYRLFRIDCTSRYTAKIAKNFGWQCVWCLPFGCYVDDGIPIFNCIQEPHSVVEVYVDQVMHCNNYSQPYRRSEKSK